MNARLAWAASLLAVFLCICLQSAPQSARAFVLTYNVPSGLDGCAIQTTPVTLPNYSNTLVTAIRPFVTAGCTSGHTPAATMAINNGLNSASCPASPSRCMTNGSAFLKYGLYTDNTYATVWNAVNTVAVPSDGTARLYSIYVQVPAAQGVAAGAYSDTLTLTIAF